MPRDKFLVARKLCSHSLFRINFSVFEASLIFLKNGKHFFDAYEPSQGGYATRELLDLLYICWIGHFSDSFDLGGFGFDSTLGDYES